jgi:metal-dependent amidase/aminoacylase/carboxypeptidase family protein
MARVAFLASTMPPGVGHGCGHNICTAVAAGMVRAAVSTRRGSVSVIGTLAQEAVGVLTARQG